MLTNDSDREPEWALTSASCFTICFTAYMEVVVVPRVSELWDQPAVLQNYVSLILCFTVY